MELTVSLLMQCYQILFYVDVLWMLAGVCRTPGRKAKPEHDANGDTD